MSDRSKRLRRYVGRCVQCHTHFGTFHGVMVHCTSHHLILAPIPAAAPAPHPAWPASAVTAGTPSAAYALPRGWFTPGPGAPGGPGPGGPPPGGGPPWGGGGWNLAIPLAAILGITAIGMHWW